MRYKPGFSRILFLAVDVAVLLGIGFVCIAPVWHVVMASISDPTALGSTRGLVFWPLKRVDATAYQIILQAVGRLPQHNILYYSALCAHGDIYRDRRLCFFQKTAVFPQWLYDDHFLYHAV